MNVFLKIVTDVRVVVVVITIAAGAVINDKIESVTQMLVAANQTLQSIQQVLDIDPAVVTEMSERLNEGAQVVGEGFGNGGATVVTRIGEAWNNFGQTPTE